MHPFSLPTITISTGTILTVLGYLYQRRRYAKSLARQLELEKFGTYVRRGLGYRLSRYLRPRAAAALSLREFAMNRLEASPPNLLVPAAVPVELPLDKMFVPLTALSTEQQRISASQIAYGNYRRVLLVGDPGSGKSTLVRRVYRDICRNAVASIFAGRVPVLIELKNLEVDAGGSGEAKSTSLADLVRREVISVHTYSGDDLYDSFVKDGRVTVMLDGLDEVKTSDFDKVAQEIIHLSDALARAHKDNSVIVTTRRQLYVNLPPDFKGAFGDHLTLEPFTTDDMYEFLRKWPYKRNPEQEFARIFGNLASQPNIRSMCQTPLILAMYVATDQITGGEGLPETRPDFYKAVTDELLVRRRGRQLGLTTGLNVLRRSRQQILGRLALEHLLDGTQSRNTLRWDAAVKIVRKQEGLSAEEAAVRIRELSRDTGLFTEERQEETLRFIHLTFCEFLAATTIVQGAAKSWDQIVRGVAAAGDHTRSKRFIERVAEVIVFAVALDENEQVRKQRVAWAVTSCGADVGLRTMLDAQPYDNAEALAELQRLADAVATAPVEDRDESWLHTFRQIAMVLRDRELVEHAMTGRNGDFLAPFFVRTVRSHLAGFDQLFLSYVRLDPAGALQLSQSIDVKAATNYPILLARALDEPAVLAHALARFSSDEAGVKEWAPILTIGALTYSSVAQRLLLTPARDDVERMVSGGNRHGWQRNVRMKGTTLGTVLEASRRWPGSSIALRLLAKAPIRRNSLSYAIGGVRMLDCLMIVAMLLMVGIAVALFGLPRYLLAVIDVAVVAVILGLVVRYRWHTAAEQLLQSPVLLTQVSDMRHPMPRAAAAFAADPDLGVLEAIRINQSEPFPEGVRAPLSLRLTRRLPAFLTWAPNAGFLLRYFSAVYVLATEVAHGSAAPPGSDVDVALPEPRDKESDSGTSSAAGRS